MRFTQFIPYGLLFSLFGCSIAFADVDPNAPATELVIEANDVYVPAIRLQAKRHEELQKYNKNFDFDWSTTYSVTNNEKLLIEIENFLKKIDDFLSLSKEDQQILGTLLYKLGTFYSHIYEQADLAINKLTSADSLLTSKEEKAWDFNQLAFAYQQRYAITRQAADRDKALYYSSKVINDFYPNMKNNEVAFAYCVKGLVQHDAQEYTQAALSFQTALAIYESLPAGKNNQYARTKLSLADTLFDQNNGQEKDIIAMLEEIKQYWQTKGDINYNPYAAKNLISLGQAYLKVNDVTDAQEVLKKAALIYENIYGHGNEHLALPYKLLSEAYRKGGNQQLADVYEQKATAVNTSGV